MRDDIFRLGDDQVFDDAQLVLRATLRLVMNHRYCQQKRQRDSQKQVHHVPQGKARAAPNDARISLSLRDSENARDIGRRNGRSRDVDLGF